MRTIDALSVVSWPKNDWCLGDMEHGPRLGLREYLRRNGHCTGNSGAYGEQVEFEEFGTCD